MGRGWGLKRTVKQQRSVGPAWPTLVTLGLFCAVLGTLAFGMWRTLYYTLGFAAPPPAPPPVVEPPTRVVQATVVGRKGFAVTAPFSSTVAQVHVQRGDRVTRGQLLFQLDTERLKERLRLASAGAERAEAALEAARRGQAQAVEAARAGVASRAAAVGRQRAQLQREYAAIRGVRRQLKQGAWSWSAAEYALHDAQNRAAYALARLKQLKQEHAVATARLAADQRKWSGLVAEREAAFRSAKEGPAPLKAQIAQAKRYSPVDGVVTSVKGAEGTWIAARRPVVRVDDPSGYRLVALVRERAREPLTTGITVAVRGAGAEAAATLEKIQPGWGTELFRYWLHLVPERPDNLLPREVVQIVLPTRAGPAAFAREAGPAPADGARDTIP